ncbi:hypothetical protein F4677DRAFT_283018 [Hypoxylon crocopeplum]|nr:hypothetical protein F4677DRAFT_283018 [Hypoxylon crocopeplum]
MLAQLLSPKMGIALLSVLSSLGAAIAGPVEAQEASENATTTVAAMSTVTGYAHPLTLLALTTLGSTQTPLSYASPPTAITVPTLRQPPNLAEATSVPAETEAVPVATANGHGKVYAVTATAISVCTSIGGVYPTATVPNFCNPSAQVNAAGFLPARGALPTATVSVGGVSNKLDCCVQCAGVFNCVAWRFVPVHTQAPNAHLPGGFDPWGRGDCEAVYHTGNPDEEQAAGIISVADGEGTANLCPNGKVGEILSGSSGEDSDSGVNGTKPGSWSNLYYNGWNEGPCAEPVAPFESGKDAGRGDADSLCS